MKKDLDELELMYLDIIDCFERAKYKEFNSNRMIGKLISALKRQKDINLKLERMKYKTAEADSTSEQ